MRAHLQPPPLPHGQDERRHAPLSPLMFSALVYAGAGQFVQRRWMAGVFFSLVFSWPFIWFLDDAERILRAYALLALGERSSAEPFPSFNLLVKPFLLGLLIYGAGLLDTHLADRRARPPSASTVR